MNTSTTGKLLIGISILLSVLGMVSSTVPLIGTSIGSTFGAISTILFIVGIVLWLSGGRRISVLAVLKRLGFNRHDIIKSTNWARLGVVELAKPAGASLLVIGLSLLILELVFGEPYPLLYVWAVIIVVGIILLIWRPSSITNDHTKKILIKIPNLLSVHTFHTSLRQCLENAGYTIAENVSPGESSSTSSLNNSILLINGGIRGLKKSTSPSKLLVAELAETPVLSNVFTLFGLGILLVLLGLTLAIHGTTTWRFETWASVIGTISTIMFLVGIAFLIFDYVTRTSRSAQIYVIEEGTAYIPTINIYDPRLLEKPGGSRTHPNVTVMHSSCELIVTVGATRNRFFDSSELDNDFNTIISSIENIANDNTLNVRDVIMLDK